MENDFDMTESFYPKDFDFVVHPDSDSQESLLLELEKNTELLGAINLNSEPRTPLDSDSESRKSFSMLTGLDLSSDKCDTNDDFQEENVLICDVRSYEEQFFSFVKISETAHKAVQTECYFVEQKSDLRLMKDAPFIESFIAIRNLSNSNLKTKTFSDILASYSFRFGSESQVSVDPNPLDKGKATSSEKNNVIDIWSYRSNSPAKKKRKHIPRENKISDRYSLRSKKRKTFLNNESEEENSSESCLDFTPKLDEDLESCNGNWSDVSMFGDSSVSSICGKKHRRNTLCAMRTVNNEVIIDEALKTFLTCVENITSESMVALGQMWKNSSIEDGMKIVNRLVECDVDGIDLQALVFNISKKIVNSFFEESINNGNHESEYKAAFLTVTCISPYFYLDLINYSIDTLMFINMQMHLETSSSRNLNRFSFGLYFVCRVLKSLLERFYRDLETNSNDLLILLQTSSKTVTILNFWKKTWNTSKSESNESPDFFHNFEIMLHRWFAYLDELLAFCLREFQLMTYLISECRTLVQYVIEIIFRRNITKPN